jgi:hypothetical protein
LEDYKTSSTFLTGIPYPTIVKLSRERIVKRKRRFDGGKSRELNPARAKLLRDTDYKKYKRNEIPAIYD